MSFFLFFSDFSSILGGQRGFLPCEIALLEFSLVDGIIETFQSFIRPPDSEVPLGYGFKIQTKVKNYSLT